MAQLSRIYNSRLSVGIRSVLRFNVIKQEFG